MGTRGNEGLPRHGCQIFAARGTFDFSGTSPPQRIRLPPPDRPDESGKLMTTSILRTADSWWVQTPNGAARIATTAATTGQLLAERAAIEAAAHSSDMVAVETLTLLSPVTSPCRVAAQMTNFASHVRDAGMDP